MKYAIVTNNIPKIASQNAVLQHIQDVTERHFAIGTILKWPDTELNNYDVYRCIEVKESLLQYQSYSSPVLTFDGSNVTMTYSAVDDDLDSSKDRAKETVASNRYNYEISGVSYNDIYVSTDRESQSKIIAVDVIASRDSSYSVRWKTANNTFVTMNSDTILQVSNTVLNHVQSAYTLESNKIDEIDACLTLTDLRSANLVFNGGS
jgi:hypothetical protein